MRKEEAVAIINVIIREIKSQTFAVSSTHSDRKFINRNLDRIHALNKAKEALNSGSDDCTDVFDKMKYRCEYGHLSYDENRVGSWTCHHNNNRPKGCSWGTCDRSVCPILKGGE